MVGHVLSAYGMVIFVGVANSINHFEMLDTHGLTHLAIKVRDIEKSRQFYEMVFGARTMYQSDTFIQLQTPGARDIIVLEKSEEVLHNENGIIHFGFRLKTVVDIDTMVKVISSAGGKIKETGEFVPDEPYIFMYDPDGYEVEVWYEKIPPELKTFN